MDSSVLLILRVPSSHDEAVTIGRVNGRVDILTVGGAGKDERAAERAFADARTRGCGVVALLILSTDLVHWGYNDIILPGPAKARFVGHVREELLRRSGETVTMLKEKACEYEVGLTIRRVESQDPAEPALAEAARGYARIYMAEEKRKRFPIFKKTVEQQLRKETPVPIVACA